MTHKILEGKVALITGASSGIGRETARLFARHGASLILVARSKEVLSELEKEISAAGNSVLTIAADLRHISGHKSIIEKGLDAFGGIDILVNSAGVIATGSIKDTTVEDWEKMFTLNVTAVFSLIRNCLPALIKRKGNIVNVSSVTGLRSFPNVLSYSASKAALDQLTRCASLELAPDGVRVNAVNPGVTVTNLHKAGGMDETSYAAFLENSKKSHPLGRPGEAGEVAELILFLASEKAGWITGVTYSIDGGRAQTCLR